MRRWDGDFMTFQSHLKPIRIKFAFKELDGTEHVIKASEINMAREDKKDIPIEFHTMLNWLGEGRAAAMDRDSGDHV